MPTHIFTYKETNENQNGKIYKKSFKEILYAAENAERLMI